MNIKPQRKQNTKKPEHTGKKQKRPRKITSSYLHNSGLYYLQRFSSSVENFRRVMGRKIVKSCLFHEDQDEAECKKLLETTIDTFIKAGLLDDSAYISAVVTSMRRQGKSSKAIQYKLSTKGVDTCTTKKYLDAYNNAHENAEVTNDMDTQGVEFLSALISTRKKRIGPFRKNDLSDDKDERQKQKTKELSYLARAGFSYQMAQKALNTNLTDAQDFIYNNT